MPVAPEYLHLVYPGPMPAFLYGRASHDPRKKGSSVADQLAEGKRLADEYQWPIVDVFKDVDESASRHRKGGPRKDFEAMLDGILAKRCRIVVAFEASRYYRDLDAYLRLRNACAQAGVLLCYDGQVYDLTKRADRKATARDALDAEDEAEGIRERNLRTARQHAAKGHPHGRILYGYRRRYDQDTGDLIDQVPHEEHAAVVRDVFERIAAGESEYSVRADLNRGGVPSPSGEGTQWRPHQLRIMLRNPSYQGRRVHQGKVLTDGKWPPLVDEATWAAVQDVLASPTRAATGNREVRHWLSGIARCGPCDERGVRTLLRMGIRKSRKGEKSYGYQCRNLVNPDARNCVGIRELLLDAYVEEALLTWLGSPRLAAAFEPGGDAGVAAAAARAVTLRRQLDEARASAATIGPDGAPALSVASLAALEAALVPQIAAADADARPRSIPAPLEAFRDVADVEAVWADLDITQRRAVARTAVTVRLWPARAPGVRRIEPGRVTLAFAGEPGFVPLLRGGDGERVTGG
jgi:site-specific DNA recombinase